MSSDDIRKKFINFFKSSPRNHQEISPAPLVLENDPSTLFTSSGMQPLIPYLLGEEHPEGKRLVNSQPSLRTIDIDEVGDNRHLTYFEMLGNWSLGDYFKEEQLAWFWEFITKELKLPKEKLWVSVFEGTKGVPKDEESYEIWKKLGVPEKKILYYGADKNWWSRSGTPDEMPEGEIGGPDSEVFFEFPQVKHDPKYGSKCHPNCDCGRFLEIGNSVFIQYKKTRNGLEELPQRNVDFGGGLERIAAALRDDPDVFNIDHLSPIIRQLESRLELKYDLNDKTTKSLRIIADHLRASVFLIADGVSPSNKLRGYVLRRLLRRSASKTYLIKEGFDSKDFKSLVRTIIDIYQERFKEVDRKKVESEVAKEVRWFRRTIRRGFREFEKHKTITGKVAFDLYQTYGFPVEVTGELMTEKGQKIDRKQFEIEFEKHKKLSRTASAGMFKGGLADHSEEVTKLHTTTHLLHAALRKVLGKHVEQKGSNITKDRLRFDFSHTDKLTDEEVGKVEKLMNEQIEKDLPVTSVTMTQKEAKDEGALGFFGERYGEKVKVYTVGDSKGKYFSKEICGGPHVAHTGVIGRVRIKKQEKIGAGLARIYVELT